MSHRVRRLIWVVILVLLSGGILFSLYQAAVPDRLSLIIGEPVPQDIISNRAIIDRVATEQRAADQSALVQDVNLRSERVSQESLGRLDLFLSKLDQARHDLYVGEEPTATTPLATSQEGTEPNGTPGATTTGRRLVPSQAEINAKASQITTELQEEQGTTMNSADIATVLGFSDSVYLAFRTHASDISRNIMQGEHDSYSLLLAITTRVNNMVQANEFYKNELGMIATFLRVLLQPNMTYDQNATLAAKEAVAAQVRANPILIPAGTLIVSSGEALTEAKLQNLRDLDLVDTGQVNWRMLVSLLALYLLVLAILWIYFRYYEKHQMRTQTDWIITIATVSIVIFVASYVSGFSPLLMPVYFLAIILSTYFGLRTSLVITSMIILLLYPITYLNQQYLFVAIMGSWAAALIAAAQTRTRNYVMLIVGTTLVSFASSVIYSTMTQTNTTVMLQSAGLVTANSALSAILAVGLSPIYELVVSSVSPMKLITLSDPSAPLLRKLFLEAPGTYQHSMMIANLAETAAERIGANSLLVRVGAYYHDIGKTWNPLMYTENQKGFNPHSLLTTEESVRVIFRHVSFGEELGRRYRLPQEIINFTSTHHGTTVMSYFYNQATEEAKAKGLPAPDPKDFTYPGTIPMNRETGIFMLADTVEAAVRSAGITHVDEAEKFIRKLVRTKVDQDQLVNSGLSFQDVEDIIHAFLQVYAGQFHERIKYPDASPVSEPSK